MGERAVTEGSLHQVHAAYVESRRWALGESTRRIRLQLRRLPRHSADQTKTAQRKALVDVLAERGESDQ